VSEAENQGQWELYNLRRDRIEARDLAAKQPRRVQEMSARWEQMNRTFVGQGGGD
jgi:arylsulfatase A-like enzyme